MDRVNFRCGHCGHLIAVSSQHVGLQVRCPHCQQVVVAPPAGQQPAAAAAPPPPAPAPQPPASSITAPEEHDSIFSPTETDDIFGRPSGPRFQVPTEEVVPPDPPAAPAASPPLPNLDLTATEVDSPAPPQGPADATLTFVQADVTRSPAAAASAGPATQVVAAGDSEPPPWLPSGASGEGYATDEGTAAILAKTRSRSGWHIALFIIPLISYALLASVAVGVLWFRLQKLEARPHPLEMLPDIEGQFPTNLKGTKVAVHQTMKRLDLMVPKHDTKLPAHLKTTLGQTLYFDDLEVTPVRVERGRISLLELDSDQTQELTGDSLKLYLKLKNVSTNLTYRPLDRYFTRFYRPGDPDGIKWQSADVPYTYLEVGDAQFFGGPAGFYDLDLDKVNRKRYANQTVVGQELERKLGPGEEMEAFICTDPEDKELEKALAQHKGPLLWRVQLRRGAVEHSGRRIPCTAVIGVELDETAYKKGRDG